MSICLKYKIQKSHNYCARLSNIVTVNKYPNFAVCWFVFPTEKKKHIYDILRTTTTITLFYKCRFNFQGIEINN